MRRRKDRYIFHFLRMMPRGHRTMRSAQHGIYVNENTAQLKAPGFYFAEILCPIRILKMYLSLWHSVSGVEYPPLKPAPSARISSSSGVAPPVMSERIRVNAFWLKYV